MHNKSIISFAIFGFLLSLAVTSQFNSALAQGTVKSCTNSVPDAGAIGNYSYDAACLGGTTNAGTTVVTGATSVAAANATQPAVSHPIKPLRSRLGSELVFAFVPMDALGIAIKKFPYYIYILMFL